MASPAGGGITPSAAAHPRWLFVFDGIITLPIAFIGFAVFPGLPNSPKKWFMSEEEYTLATERMRNKDGTTGIDRGIDWKSIKYTLSRPMWYICVSAYM
jgi:ACS family pantothenate transporter-like MFS transporter